MTGAGPDLTALFDSLSVPYAIMDRDFRYVALNALLEETVSRPREEMVGKSLFDLFPEIEERQAVIEAAFSAAFDGTPTSMAEVPYSIPVPGQPGKMREIWWTFHCTPIPDPDGAINYVGFHAENITKQIQARDLKDAIARELQHRVSNTLSLVQVIARQTAGSYPDVNEFLDVFDDRIHSLAKTHALLTGTNWDGLTFDALLAQQLEAHLRQFDGRLTLEGPSLLLSANEAQALSMALHELTTNALKYGALSGKDGKVSITWDVLEPGGYEITWAETGLTDLDIPTREGFGTTILTRILPGQIGGKANQSFSSEGHTYRIVVNERRG